MMQYYMEQRGHRIPIKEWDYERMVRLEGWHHIIMQPGLTIIGKRGE